jgi:hypothetical protein
MFLNQGEDWFTLSALKHLINLHGKSNKQIAQEITEFVNPKIGMDGVLGWIQRHNPIADGSPAHGCAQPEFYGYYADYDWVLLCSLYGRMLNLPKGFPMYCHDLKQMLDSKIVESAARRYNSTDVDDSFDVKLRQIKSCDAYPKQYNAHNALDDARWNKSLYEFIQNPKNYLLR